MRKLRHVLLLGIIAVSVLALTSLITPASAGLQIAETSTKRVGATEIRWNSSFQDMDYTLGNTITMAVEWEVLDGAAEYVDFRQRHPGFTPRSWKDPAEGTAPSVSQSGNTVTVEFSFTGLHLDRRRNVEIGNAKFKLYLQIDFDGDGILDVIVGYGVNVHVEDPQ